MNRDLPGHASKPRWSAGARTHTLQILKCLRTPAATAAHHFVDLIITSSAKWHVSAVLHCSSSFKTLLYLWAAPYSVKSSSIWFQALCCSFSVASLSLPSSHGGGTSFMLVFDIQLTVGARRSKSHRHHPWPFVIGPRSVPRHRLPFKAGLCPAVIKVLFSASLNPRSVKKTIAPLSSFVIPPPCVVTHSQKVV